MKTLKSKLLMLTLLLIGVVAMSFTLVNKEKSEAKTEVKAPTTWRYNSSSTTEGAFANGSNWVKGSGSGCGTNGDKPCQIIVDADDPSELTDYFGDMSNEEILDLLPNSRRN